MAFELRSKRENRKAETQEDIKYLLEEVWNFDPEGTFYKIFSKQDRNGSQDAVDLSKEELKDFTWRGNNVKISKLEPNEVGKFRGLKNCNAFREAKGDFPSDPRDLRHNNVIIED